MLDDFFDLGAVQGFVLQQSFCDRFEFVAIRHEGRSGKVISVIQQFPHLLVDLLRSRSAAVAGTSLALCVGNARLIPGAIMLISCPRLPENLLGQDFSYAILRIAKKSK